MKLSHLASRMEHIQRQIHQQKVDIANTEEQIIIVNCEVRKIANSDLRFMAFMWFLVRVIFKVHDEVSMTGKNKLTII